MPRVLEVSVRFPLGAYSGADLGVAEEIPSPARLHEALVAAAAGGSWSEPDGPVLVACPEHVRALEWLEEHEPIGIVVPPLAFNDRSLRRYRWRASPVAPADTDFEPRCAIGGPVSYLWPLAPGEIRDALAEIATEVTHVGRADSIALVAVSDQAMPSGPGVHRLQSRRGPGRVLRIPRHGRTHALTDAHAEVSQPGRHTAGSMGKQAPDELVTGANPTAIEPRRFEPASQSAAWPYAELWALELDGVPSGGWPVHMRVSLAVALHRAIVAAIGEDVPPFVTGRDGLGPQRGAGHLALHVARWPHATSRWRAYLAIPRGVSDADRSQLAAALERSLQCGHVRGRLRFVAHSPQPVDVAARELDPRTTLITDVPFVVEVNGGPRRGGWTLDDAAVCSVGFALRGVLEEYGVEWDTGWAFRERLVATLRDDFGIDARARRVTRRSSAFVHRSTASELVVAADAAVVLGDLALDGGVGFLALGRARHLGGGLLVPGAIGDAR